MVSGKYSAVAGAVAREQHMANISANLANVNTSGYRRNSVSFESLLRGARQTQEAEGINYSRVKQNVSDFTPGPLRETANQFHVAIEGDGFFKIQGPNGPLYTRRGDFVIDQEGILKTSSGHPVLGEGNSQITIPDTDISKVVIAQDGSISLIDRDGISTDAAQLSIVDIDDRSFLKRDENTAFSLALGGNEIPLETPQVVQGFLELSNVNMSAEMTHMINSLRTFETYHKVLESYSTLGQQQDELGTIG